MMLLTQVSLERSNNTTQPKQDPRVCLSVLSTRNEIEEPATNTREGGEKKTKQKQKQKQKQNKTKKIKYTTNTKKQLQWSNALSFFLSRPPPPPQSSSHSTLMDGLT
jgi:hypothetical protein